MLTYQSFRPSDLFPDLRDLLIVLIVVKRIDSSMSVQVRVSCFEFRRWCVRVTDPHVLHKLVIHPKHDKHPNFIGFQADVQVRHNQLDTRQDTLTEGFSVQGNGNDRRSRHNHWVRTLCSRCFQKTLIPSSLHVEVAGRNH